MTERIDDPTKTPPVLVGDRRSLGCARDNGPFNQSVRVFGGQKDAASPPSDRTGAEALHALARRADPERPFAHCELSDDVLAVADAVQDARTECPLVEVDSCRRTFHPQFWLHAHRTTNRERYDPAVDPATR